MLTPETVIQISQKIQLGTVAGPSVRVENKYLKGLIKYLQTFGVLFPVIYVWLGLQRVPIFFFFFFSPSQRTRR